MLAFLGAGRLNSHMSDTICSRATKELVAKMSAPVNGALFDTSRSAADANLLSSYGRNRACAVLHRDLESEVMLA